MAAFLIAATLIISLGLTIIGTLRDLSDRKDVLEKTFSDAGMTYKSLLTDEEIGSESSVVHLHSLLDSGYAYALLVDDAGKPIHSLLSPNLRTNKNLVEKTAISGKPAPGIRTIALEDGKIAEGTIALDPSLSTFLVLGRTEAPFSFSRKFAENTGFSAVAAGVVFMFSLLLPIGNIFSGWVRTSGQVQPDRTAADQNGQQKSSFWSGSGSQDAYNEQDLLSHEVLDSLAMSSMSMQEGLLVLDSAENILLCNDVLKEIFRLDQDCAGKTFDDVFSPANADVTKPAVFSLDFYLSLKNAVGPLSTEITLHKDGLDSHYYLFSLVSLVAGQKVTICCLKNIEELSSFQAALSHVRDTLEETVQEQNDELRRINAQLRIENSERSAVVQALRRAESRYRDIFDNATEGIFQWTPGWKLLTANTSFAGMLGYATVNYLMYSYADKPFQLCSSDEVAEDLVAKLEEKGQVSNFELQVVRQDGTPLWASINARQVMGPGGITAYYEAFIENITDRKTTEEKLRYQAFHDPLTGLANRSLFFDRLHMAIRRAMRHPDYKFAVLYLDLDRFKVVNDSFGHNTGDEVLCHAAMAIVASVRELDTVARFGGDEFAVLIENAETPAIVIGVAKRIHKTLKEPLWINGSEISVGSSIGIVLQGENYTSPEDLLRDADSAMYHAKARQNTYMRVFSQKMREETIASIALEADLRNGVRTNEFFMAYQPIVHINDGSLHGYESLMRWKRKGELVSPGEFIPMAEETGIIKNLGLYAMERVFKRIVQWSARGGSPFVMHINISGRQLLYPSFPREVQRILEETQVNPNYVRFEITESVLLDNGRVCIDSIRQIRELGVKFCLDDFGTGFSSLSYLRRLPLDCIKLDRSFVQEVETDPQSVAIVRNLICLGNDLGLSVVVEGIETQAQVEILSEAGCTLAQGFYFHRPLEADKAEQLLQ